LRRFLAELTADPTAQVVIPTTLNAAGCDAGQFDEMRIAVPDFLAHSEEIIGRYVSLGVRPILSCTPYEWEGLAAPGVAAWAESNAICFANSYCGMRTNRESGLSALASALTGYTPDYGLLGDEARRPNLEVVVACELNDPTDFSILGDWIGRQRRSHWRQPYGPIPFIRGLRRDPAGHTVLSHEQRKALSAAAANYGAPLLYIEGLGEPPPEPAFQDSLRFTEEELQRRYEELRPRQPTSLIVIGCPQASMGELRAAATLLRGRQVVAGPARGRVPIWLFTSAANLAIAERTGLAAIIRQSGALLLENTCPEVVPYDPAWVSHILTNSMKAEHYLKSGLNRIPASVLPLAACIGVATGDVEIPPDSPTIAAAPTATVGPRHDTPASRAEAGFSSAGQGLPSQGDYVVEGEAFATSAPITFLGFVNRQTGAIEEPGHPADGQTMAGKIAIFPRGIGSTVAPYVLLELYYRGQAPLAIVNSDIDQQTAPACSLTGIPYAYGFDSDVSGLIRSGDRLELRRTGDRVTLRLLEAAR
jgi:predicted aconitase/predicted aconitase with swiveling domain